MRRRSEEFKISFILYMSQLNYLNTYNSLNTKQTFLNFSFNR